MLLSEAWTSGGYLPNDEDELAVLARWRGHRGGLRKVLNQFITCCEYHQSKGEMCAKCSRNTIEIEAKYIVNRRQIDEYIEVNRQQMAGRKAAKTRWNGAKVALPTRNTDKIREDIDKDKDKTITTCHLTDDQQQLFEFWNSLKIKVHKKPNSGMKKKLIAALKDYSVDELKVAMSTYKEILESPKYSLQYKHSLESFLHRGQDGIFNYAKFMPDYYPHDKYNRFDKNSIGGTWG